MVHSPLVELAIYLSAIFSPEMCILISAFLAVTAIAISILRRVRIADIRNGTAPSFVNASVLIIGSTIIATIASQGLKRIFQIPRPVEMLVAETGFSFPSGHATLVTAFFLAGIMSIYLYYPRLPMPLRRLKVSVAVLIIIGVSTSRLILHVHRIEDVICGIILGALSVLCMKSFFKRNITVQYIHDNNSHTSH